MEAANDQGNTRKAYAVLKHLTKKPKAPPQGLTRQADGELITSPEEAAAIWQKFLSEKFDSTKAEKEDRPAMPQIPPHRESTSAISRNEFNDAVRLMSNMKAMGPDGVPAEAIKYSPAVNEALFQIIKTIWDNEELPSEFAQARFVMLYKGKGSANDPARYRCIALLNHSYKILSRILLNRLIPNSENFLNDWQAGFRPGRGCRDNITILRTLCEHFMILGECLAVTFIDYAAAFDSLSHKYIDRVLAEAHVPNKERAMFRATYSSASAFTKIRDANGKHAKSDVFPIRRGVLQGDITSPLFFIMALEFILRTHDNRPDKGVSLLGTILHTLGYADDAALLDLGDAAGIIKATERLTRIARGSSEDADMKIKIEKTKGLHVRRQDPITSTTPEEAKRVCEFKCPHAMCNFVFGTKHGMRIHASRCRYKDEYEVEKILDSKGPVCAKKFKIRWRGYGPEADTWESRSNVHPELIRDFELENGCYNHNWRFRCHICDLPCASDRGVKIHIRKAHDSDMTTDALQSFKGSTADKLVQKQKWKAQQETRPKIYCGNNALDNVFLFTYLGSRFAADGRQSYDIKSRIAMAFNRCGELRHMFDSPVLSNRLKLRLYIAAVVSVLTYGCESWFLNPKVMAKLNGANSKMLARIMGTCVRDEARSSTAHFDLVKEVRARRLKWAGGILRMDEHRLLHKAIEAQLAMNVQGGLLMDAPTGMTLNELKELAKDKTLWKRLRESIPSHLRRVGR